MGTELSAIVMLTWIAIYALNTIIPVNNSIRDLVGQFHDHKFICPVRSNEPDLDYTFDLQGIDPLPCTSPYGDFKSPHQTPLAICMILSDENRSDFQCD